MSQQPVPVETKPPPPFVVRWAVLICVGLAMFGNYYIYDSISLVADLLRDQLGFSDSDIGWLNAIYSYASILMLFVAAVIIDRLGTRSTLFFFTILCVAGAAVTAFDGSLTVMLVGRALFGLGAEAMIVAVTTALAKWFRGKELGLALGINLLMARAGTWAAFQSPGWARSWYDDWQWPLVLAALVGITCIIGALIYWAMETSSEGAYNLGQAGAVDRLKWSDVSRFGRSYWYITALCATFYAAIFPFQTFAIKLLIDTQGVTREAAGDFMSFLPIIAMFLTPAFGLFSDLIGKRSHLMILGSILLMPIYLMLAYTSLPVGIPIGILGFAFALIPAVMWPSVAYIVEPNRLGTAYATMTLVQQGAIALFNNIIALANDYSGAGAANPGGYALGLWLFSILGFLGIFFAIQLNRAEAGRGPDSLDRSRVLDRKKAAADQSGASSQEASQGQGPSEAGTPQDPSSQGKS